MPLASSSEWPMNRVHVNVAGHPAFLRSPVWGSNSQRGWSFQFHKLLVQGSPPGSLRKGGVEMAHNLKDMVGKKQSVFSSLTQSTQNTEYFTSDHQKVCWGVGGGAVGEFFPPASNSPVDTSCTYCYLFYSILYLKIVLDLTDLVLRLTRLAPISKNCK